MAIFMVLTVHHVIVSLFANIIIIIGISFLISIINFLFSFGYVIEGSDFLQDVKEGDVIVSAKVTEGLENLKNPQ